MPAEATIENIDPAWLSDEEAFMRRLKQIISGDENGPYKQETGYAWQLDGLNNWWAEIQGENTLIIACRGENNDRFKALVNYLKACFCRT